MNVTSLSSQFGALVTDCDVRDCIESDRAALQSALDRHRLLVFPCQQLDAPAQIRFLGLFGPVADEHRDGQFYCLLSNTAPEGRNSSNAGRWHQDYSQTPFPLEVISLHATELTGPVAGTRFVNTAQAHQQLDGGLRARSQSRSVLMVSRQNGAPLDVSQDRAAVKAAVEGRGDQSVKVSAFPLIATHPSTGESMLRANELFSLGIQGESYEAGQELLTELFGALYAPAGVVEHQWQQGDLVVWDNRALQHSRASLNPAGRPATRTLQRVTVSDRMDDIFAYLPELAGDGIPKVGMAG